MLFTWWIGNALVLYENEESYKSVTLLNYKRSFELSGGGGRLAMPSKIDHLDKKGSL